LIHLDIGLTDLCLRLAMLSAAGQSEVGRTEAISCSLSGCCIYPA